MLKRIIQALVIASLLAFAASLWAALPTAAQIYQAASAGNYKAAQLMMDKVLAAHPNSAKAHYVGAQVLAKQGKFEGAREELGAAMRLDPKGSFANAQALEKLQAQIRNRGHALGSGGQGIAGAAQPTGVLPLTAGAAQSKAVSSESVHSEGALTRTAASHRRPMIALALLVMLIAGIFFLRSRRPNPPF